mmetsp:Transcript_21310/g.51611  ORF Transcript_21310/g.51611 Transcript_21310/m.51611 type:complete len:204 (+) Transcript_21310:128-739(+)
MVWAYFLLVVTVLSSGSSVAMEVDAKAHVTVIEEAFADVLEVAPESLSRAAIDSLPATAAAHLTWSVDPPKRRVQVDGGAAGQAVVSQTAADQDTNTTKPWIREVVPVLLQHLRAAREMSLSKIATSAVGAATLLVVVFAVGFCVYRWNVAKQREEMMDQNEQLIAKLTKGKHKWSREAFGRIPREPLIGAVIQGDCGRRWQN